MPSIMQPQPDTLSYEPKRSRAKQIVLAAIALCIGLAWLVQTMRKGTFTADASAVSMVTYTRPAAGERDVLPNAFVSASLNAGHAIDPQSIDNTTVKLFRADNDEIVPAQVNTSAAGDAIVLTPLKMLQPRTTYTFQIKGVKDSTGADMLPYSMSFTTSGGSQSSRYPAAFDKVPLPGDEHYYTGLTVGPDHRLYAGTVDGKIIRREILPDGALGDSQLITTLQSANQGPRLITGIRFDPRATRENMVLWVSHGQFILDQRGKPALVGASEWTGKISTLSGADLIDYRDVVVNLPRSWRDHLNNQLDFGPDGCIYFSQGSHTAMGAPDKKWGPDRVERMLSAAVLRVDPSKIIGTLDVKTPDGGGAYDPFASEAPLTIYASGVRVGYDMLWHSNGNLYTAVNGSAAGGKTPATPSSRKFPRRIDGPYDGPAAMGLIIGRTQPDLLLKLERGRYYGQPNPARGEYILNGGNPTNRVDPLEVTDYPVGTNPDRNWRPPAYSFGTSVSPNGMIEFKSNGKLFGGALDGKLLVTRFSGVKDIMVLALDGSGDVVESITGICGLTEFTQPLDLAQDPQTGCIYVAEYGGEKLTLLRPVTDPARIDELQQNVFRQSMRVSSIE
ncbi:MAG: Ig-like domain-containing protein [Tepidisphaeraceae bacterium]